MFNAKRGGEPPALTVEEWQDAENDKWKKGHLLSLLEDSEKHLADRLKVLYISGKRHRKVLFTEETIATVCLLITTCNKVGLGKQNKFMFVRQYDSTNHIHGWQAVRSEVCSNEV